MDLDLFTAWLPRLLTAKERLVLQKRFKLVGLLRTDLTYRQIAKQMKISTTTVVRLNRRLKIRKGKRKLKPLVLAKEKKLPWLIG